MASVRERIYNAAITCFERQGTAQTRVQDICEQAKVSRTSFYREFRNVDDVLASVALQQWSNALTVILKKVQKIPTAKQRWHTLMTELAIGATRQSVLDRNNENLLSIVRLMYVDDGKRYLSVMVELLRPMIEQDQINNVLRTDISLLDISDWLLRQAWALSSVPLPGDDEERRRALYIDEFILPGLLKPPIEQQNSQRILDRLDAIEKNLLAIDIKL